MIRRYLMRINNTAYLVVFALATSFGSNRSRGTAPGDTLTGSKLHQVASPADTQAGDRLHSQFLMDLVFERGPSNNVGSPGVKRVVVAVSGGTFEGPRLKGTVVNPSGDWMVVRPDGTSSLDIRFVLQTDDDQKILMTCRGIAYKDPGGELFARIVPMFEAGAEKYAWLNKVIAVGVYKSIPGKVEYRVYQIL